jgi:hypothetical protein
MGILWRLFAPQGLKRACRSVRRAAHPVRPASWALSPRPVKKAPRGATDPGEALEWVVSDQVGARSAAAIAGAAGGDGEHNVTTGYGHSQSVLWDYGHRQPKPASVLF